MEKLKTILKIYLPAIISIIAITVSLLSFYLTQLRPAELIIIPPNKIQFWHSAEFLHMDLNIILKNTGIDSLYLREIGILIDDGVPDHSILLKKGAFRIFNNNSKIWIVDKAEQNLIIPGKSSIYKNTDFSGYPNIKNWIPKPGIYTITILAWLNDDEIPDCKTIFKIEITQRDTDDIKFCLEENKSFGITKNLKRKGGESRILSKFEYDSFK